MPISLPEAEDEHEQKPEAKGDQSPRKRKGVGPRSVQRLELEDHNELYAYLVDARLGLTRKIS